MALQDNQNSSNAASKGASSLKNNGIKLAKSAVKTGYNAGKKIGTLAKTIKIAFNAKAVALLSVVLSVFLVICLMGAPAGLLSMVTSGITEFIDVLFNGKETTETKIARVVGTIAFQQRHASAKNIITFLNDEYDCGAVGFAGQYLNLPDYDHFMSENVISDNGVKEEVTACEFHFEYQPVDEVIQGITAYVMGVNGALANFTTEQLGEDEDTASQTETIDFSTEESTKETLGGSSGNEYEDNDNPSFTRRELYEAIEFRYRKLPFVADVTESEEIKKPEATNKPSTIPGAINSGVGGTQYQKEVTTTTYSGNIDTLLLYSVSKYKKEEIDSLINYLIENEDMSYEDAYDKVHTLIDDEFENYCKQYDIDLSSITDRWEEEGYQYGVAGVVMELIDLPDLGWSGKVADASIFQTYSSQSIILGNTEQADAIWMLVHQQPVILYSANSRQCTDFAHARFYLEYGFDCGGGDGKDMVDSTYNLYPDLFAKSLTPAPGALFSYVGEGKNHVGFVEGYDAATGMITISDGNVRTHDANGNIILHGARINYTMSLADLQAESGGVIFLVPVK